MHDQCIIYENGHFLVGMIFVTLMPHCWILRYLALNSDQLIVDE